MQDKPTPNRDEKVTDHGEQAPARDGGDDALENLVTTGADLDEDLNIAKDITTDDQNADRGKE
jgi:hypothetical protein